MNTYTHAKSSNKTLEEDGSLSEHEYVSSGSEEANKARFGQECPKIFLDIRQRTISCNRSSCQPVLKGTQNSLWFRLFQKSDQGYRWEFAFFRQTKYWLLCRSLFPCGELHLYILDMPFEVQLAPSFCQLRQFVKTTEQGPKLYLSGRTLAYHTWSLEFDCQHHKTNK